MLTAQPEHVLAASVDAHGAGGGKTRPGWWGASGRCDGRISLDTSPAAAQLLSVPICTCSFHSDPLSLSPQPPPSGLAPGPSDRPMEEPRLDPDCLPLGNVRQVNSNVKRISAFSAFPSLARVHSGKLRLGTLGAHTARRGSRGNHLGSPGPALRACRSGVRPTW